MKCDIKVKWKRVKGMKGNQKSILGTKKMKVHDTHKKVTVKSLISYYLYVLMKLVQNY